MLPTFDPWYTASVAADVWAAGRSDAASLQRRQARRLRQLLESAAKGSRLYRDCLPARDPAGLPLQQLPVSRKSELMRHFDDWVTEPSLGLAEVRRFIADGSRVGEAFQGRFVVWESSGSTGEPGIFVQDARAMAVYDMLEVLRHDAPAWPGLAVPWITARPDERVAFLGATGGHFASVVSIERLRRLNPAFQRRVRSVSFLQPIEQWVAAIAQWQPGVLATYPSAAMLLAQEKRAGRLQLNLREVWTGGETLTPSMRRGIEQGLGCKVVNSYGASEFLALATECREGRMHLNSDWFILEPVDERGRPVPAGEASATTLLTNLANHLQPLIRYDLGDRVTVLPGPCACGSALPVVEVQGRRDDTLRLAGKGRRLVPVLPLAISTVLEDEAGLFDFQLRQQSPSELLLCTGLRGEGVAQRLSRARAVLSGFLAAQGASGVRIRCRSGQPGRQGRSGKIPRVVAASRRAERVSRSR